MGHDISAFNRVAHLGRNMWSDDIHKFYEHLDAKDHDGDVSGNGGVKLYRIQEIHEATERIRKDESLQEENKKEFIEFLKDSIKDTKNNYILIDFS